MKAQAAGFQQFVGNEVHVNTQDNTAIDVKLTVGTVDQKVTVTAAAPLLQTQDASVGQTVSGQQVNDMPLQVRDWTTLGLLSAGTTTTGSSHQSSVQRNGAEFDAERLSPQWNR